MFHTLTLTIHHNEFKANTSLLRLHSPIKSNLQLQVDDYLISYLKGDMDVTMYASLQYILHAK